MDLQIGQIVFSKRGRDKGMAFVVISIEGEYAYLVDGKLRTLEKPKKKKVIHIQMTKNVADISKQNLLNSDIRKALLQYQSVCM